MHGTHAPLKGQEVWVPCSLLVGMVPCRPSQMVVNRMELPELHILRNSRKVTDKLPKSTKGAKGAACGLCATLTSLHGGSQTGVDLMQRKYAVQPDVSIEVKLPRQHDGQTSVRQSALRISLFCVAGLSFYFGWIFCLFWSPSILPVETFGDFDAHVIRAIMAVSLSAAPMSSWLFPRFFASSRGEVFLRAVALTCCPCACAAWLLPMNIGFAWACLLWSVAGIGSSALLLVWSKKLVTLNRKQVAFSASSAFVLGSLLLGTAAFMPTGIACVAIAFTPVASVAFAWLSLLTSASDAKPAIPGVFDEALAGGAEAGRHFPHQHVILIAFSYGMGIGFVGSCATIQVYGPFAVYAIMAGNVAASAFAVFFLIRKHRDGVLVLTQAFFPAMLVCLFVFSFTGPIGQLVCLFVMFALLACHDIVDIASASSGSRLFDEKYMKTFAIRRAFNGLGCALGWVVGIVMNFVFEDDALARMFICFALAVLLMIAATFVVFRSGSFSHTRDDGGNEDKTARRPPNERGVGTALKTKAGLVADHYELTPRQAEVLICLSQGRNANYIADKFIISAHTAKSHIYNIYNKLGIHSQQELLDIVEAEEVPREVHAGSLGG